MRNKLYIVKYDDQFGYDQYCLVVSPNERLIPQFMAPYEVTGFTVVDELDTEGENDNPGMGRSGGNPGVGGNDSVLLGEGAGR